MLELLSPLVKAGFDVNTSIHAFFAKLGGVILAILAFGFLVFIHELGHFIVAKKAGVKVNEFSIGMGPVLFKRTKGETQYSIRIFPIGGFVAMEGEDEESDVKDGSSFKEASIPKRAGIMIAGAVVNLLFGFLLMGILVSVQMSKPNAKIPTNQIHSFHENAVTNKWLEPGDTIVKINNRRVKNYGDISYHLSRDFDGIVNILVDRNGEKILLENVTFDMQEVDKDVSILTFDWYLVGKKPTILSSLQYSCQQSISMIRQIWGSLIDLVRGKVNINQLSGPVGITKEMTELSAKRDWSTFFLFVAMLSLNLGVLNLMPFPALDGGKLLFLIIEAIRKKPMNEKVELSFNLIGMALILALVFTISIKDIVGLFK